MAVQIFKTKQLAVDLDANRQKRIEEMIKCSLVILGRREDEHCRGIMSLRLTAPSSSSGRPTNVVDPTPRDFISSSPRPALSIRFLFRLILFPFSFLLRIHLLGAPPAGRAAGSAPLGERRGGGLWD